MAIVAEAMEPGSLTRIDVYENVWAAPLIAAMDANGARLIGAGAIDADDLIRALDGPPRS